MLRTEEHLTRYLATYASTQLLLVIWDANSLFRCCRKNSSTTHSWTDCQYDSFPRTECNAGVFGPVRLCASFPVAEMEFQCHWELWKFEKSQKIQSRKTKQLWPHSTLVETENQRAICSTWRATDLGERDEEGRREIHMPCWQQHGVWRHPHVRHCSGSLKRG